MNRRGQLFAVHLAIPFVLFVGVGGFVLTGWLPPPSPGLSVGATARMFHHNDLMRVGVSFMALGSVLFIGPSVAISCQLRRIEGPFSALSHIQMLSAAVGVLAIQIPAYLWLVISLRQDIAPDVKTILSNLAFLLLLAAYSPAVLQNLSIGVAILTAGPGSPAPYPRWVGFANLWLATTLLPGALTPFFTSGPFAYSGIFGFWVVAVGFFSWMILMWWMTTKAIREQTPAEVGA